MLTFQTNLIKRRRLRWMAIIAGLLAVISLFGLIQNYLTTGSFPIIDEIVRFIGVETYKESFYIGIPLFLTILLYPFFRTLMKRKLVRSGQLILSEELLSISEGKKTYQIIYKDINELSINLSASNMTVKNYLKIPTKKATLKCEFELENEEKRKELLLAIDFLQKEKAIKIKLE